MNNNFDDLLRVASVATRETADIHDGEIKRILDQMDYATLALLAVAVKLLRQKPGILYTDPGHVAHCRAFADHVGATVRVTRDTEGLKVDFYPSAAH